jgi:chromosomal replication initiator protein DnaA
VESSIEDLEEEFNKLRDNIGNLEELQKRFDRLKIDHFRSEAEEIEFKMNDPYLVESIASELKALEKKILEDETKRDQFRDRINDYLKEGFTGSRKLEQYLEEDISIVDLEFRNFEKEVQLFRKYMKSVGYVFPGSETETTASDRKVEEPAAGKKGDERSEEKTSQPQKKSDLSDEKKGGIPENDLSFDNFIVGTPNEIAHTAASDVSSDPGQTYNPLLILGDTGVGKTHLLTSIARKVHLDNPKIHILFETGENFIEEMKRHRKSGKMEDFRDRFRNTDLLIVDDLHLLKESEESQDMFVNILNGTLDKKKQVVLSAERDIKSIPKLVEQIRARLDSGVSVDLEGTTPDLNMKIIKKTAGGKIGEEIADHFSTQLTNITDLKKAIQEYLSEVEKGNDDLETAKEIVDRITGDPGHRKLTEALEDTLKGIKDQKREIVQCTNCNEEIPADSKKCPKCGAIFEDVEMKECPVCKKFVELEEKQCPNCGMDF